MFKTTAIYENRIKDKKALLSSIPLNEFGDNDVYFLSIFNTLLCKGFNRIVFGDHGPYIEFLKEHIIFDNWISKRNGIGYYDKYYPIDNSSILLYAQRKDVSNLPNPPKGKYSFNGNRKEGYADYIVGRYYISPYEPKLTIIKNNICINHMTNDLKSLLE